MSNLLPARPNVEHLKAQAKDLLSAFRSGKDQDRVWAFFPTKTAITLSDAQLVVAREYGFESWPKLKAEVSRLTAIPSREEQADRLLRHLESRQLELGQKLLLDQPDLGQANLAAACATGEIKLVRSHIEATPSLVKEKIPPLDWEPLLYICFSALLQTPEYKTNLVETAKYLIDQGANVQAFWLSNGEEETCLYGATGVNGCPELTEVLLQAGADPNDEESFYHSSELADSDCLKLLLQYGGDISKPRNAFGRLFDFERPDMLRTVLENTKDLKTLPHVIPHALRRGRSTEMLRILIESGVDLSAKSVSGLTPYQSAIRMGRLDVAELLEANGADTSLSDADKLVGKITLGEPIDPSGVDPEWIKSLDGERSPQLCIWAASGNDQAIEALLQLGANVDATDENGWTALHEAALRGGLSTVQLLLKHGASPVVVERAHKAHALGCACHGSLHNRRGTPDEYAQIVTELIEHGGELPKTVWGSPEVQAVFVSYGCTPA